MRYLKYHNSSSNDGFTLIELLLYVSIVGSLLLAIVSFLMVSVDARVKNQSVSEVNQQGTAAMEYIAQTVRSATTVNSPAPAASAGSLSLAVTNAGLSPTVFDVSANALQVKEGTAAAVPLTGSKVQITNLTFKNLSGSGTNGVVQISFTVARVNPSGRNEYDYQKTFTTSVTLQQ